MLRHGIQFRAMYVESSVSVIPVSKAHKHINKPVGDMARAYTGDADAVLDHGLLIAM